MKLKSLLLYGTLVFIFSSCAFHAGFPFICFKKQCIKEQWSGTRKEAGGNISFKKRVKIFLAKQERKRNRKSKKDEKTERKTETDAFLTGDTIIATEFIRVTFVHKKPEGINASGKDSTELKSSFLVLSKTERHILDNYISKFSGKKLLAVYIQAVITEASPEENKKRNALGKMKRVAHYLEKNKVRKSKIILVR